MRIDIRVWVCARVQIAMRVQDKQLSLKQHSPADPEPHWNDRALELHTHKSAKYRVCAWNICSHWLSSGGQSHVISSTSSSHTYLYHLWLFWPWDFFLDLFISHIHLTTLTTHLKRCRLLLHTLCSFCGNQNRLFITSVPERTIPKCCKSSSSSLVQSGGKRIFRRENICQWSYIWSRQIELTFQ